MAAKAGLMPSTAPVTFKDHLTRIPPGVRPTIEAARRVVVEGSPKVREVIYQSRPPRSISAMWKLARYAGKSGWAIGIGAYPAYATLFFYQGSELTDPDGLLEGSGKAMRFIRLRQPSDVATASVKELVRQALELAG